MTLDLYHRIRCPYSAKVRDFLATHGLEDRIAYHDVDHDLGALDALMNLTGKEQVPCLVVDGEPILESDDIVRWLDVNLVQEPPSARSA